MEDKAVQNKAIEILKDEEKLVIKDLESSKKGVMRYLQNNNDGEDYARMMINESRILAFKIAQLETLREMIFEIKKEMEV